MHRDLRSCCAAVRHVCHSLSKDLRVCVACCACRRNRAARRARFAAIRRRSPAAARSRSVAATVTAATPTTMRIQSRHAPQTTLPGRPRMSSGVACRLRSTAMAHAAPRRTTPRPSNALSTPTARRCAATACRYVSPRQTASTSAAAPLVKHVLAM